MERRALLGVALYMDRALIEGDSLFDDRETKSLVTVGFGAESGFEQLGLYLVRNVRATVPHHDSYEAVLLCVTLQLYDALVLRELNRLVESVVQQVADDFDHVDGLEAEGGMLHSGTVVVERTI